MHRVGWALLVAGACGRIDFATLAPTTDGATDVPSDQPIDAIATCSDRLIDGSETDVDCGGVCGPCPVPATCIVPADCGRDVCDAGTCRHALHCRELQALQPGAPDGAAIVDPDGAGGDPPFLTFCDMTVDGGGWTLVGKADGYGIDIFDRWLVASVDPGGLASTVIAASQISCANAVHLAVNGATDVRLSDSARAHFIKWPLPPGRDVATFWRHAVGYTMVFNDPMVAVTTTNELGATAACFHNRFGVLPRLFHGGSYPSTTYNVAGNTVPGDLCASVGTMHEEVSTPSDGFFSNGNGFDAPVDDADWPNATIHGSTHVTVWLR